MRTALKAYAVWLLGIACAVALAWAYWRRLQFDLGAVLPAEDEEPPVEPPAVATLRPRPSPAGGSSETLEADEG